MTQEVKQLCTFRAVYSSYPNIAIKTLLFTGIYITFLGYQNKNNGDFVDTYTTYVLRTLESNKL